MKIDMDFIEQWLEDPTSFDPNKADQAQILPLVDRRLVDAWEHHREEERQALLNLRQALLDAQEAERQRLETLVSEEPSSKNVAGYPHFQNSSQAIQYLVERLETNSSSALYDSLAHLGTRHHREPFYLDFFHSRLFPMLQEYHQRTHFQTMYQHHHFPEDQKCFTLGGHMQELGCIHIEFIKTEEGWVLDDIWMCR
jgi:hypothetical protein